MKLGLTDIHEHLLYGLDDGPKGRRSMYRMLNTAAEQGVRRIVVTPHVTPGILYFDNAKYQQAMQEATEYCESHGLDITLYDGAEILYTDQTCRMLAEGKVLTLAGTDCVLIEFSPDVRFDRLQEALDRLVRYGYSPILAHAERYRCLTIWPPRAERLKRETGVYIQINASTVIDGKGVLRRFFARWMLKRHLIDAVASDAHGSSARPNRMRKAWKILKKEYGVRYARRLMSGRMLKEQ